MNVKFNLRTLLHVSAVPGRLRFDIWKALEGAVLVAKPGQTTTIGTVTEARFNVDGVELIVISAEGRAVQVGPRTLPGMGFKEIHVEINACPQSIVELVSAFEEAELVRIRELEASNRRKQLEVRLKKELRPFVSSIQDARSRLNVSAPSPTNNDIALCFQWSGGDHMKLKGDRSARTLCSLIDPYEAGRLLSARAAEHIAAAYYRMLGLTVEDVSITQLACKDDRWRDFDLLVRDRPIDVKNARQSFSNRDLYVEHCIPNFKQSRNLRKEVAVTGLLSEYLTKEEFIERNGAALVLGEVKLSDIQMIRNWASQRFGSFLNLDAVWASGYQPGWIFEYTGDHYAARSAALCNIQSILTLLNQEKVIDADVPGWLLALCLDPKIVALFVLTRERKEILDDLISLRDKVGFSRRSLFVYVMGIFLESIVKGAPAGQLNLLLRNFLFCDLEPTSPLWLLDTQKYISNLIDMLSIVHEEIARRQRQFVAFKMIHPSILLGKQDNEPWLTLVAYCGGWRRHPFKVKCDSAPLFFGQHANCPSCRRLVCNNCGHCSNDCDLVEGRQEAFGRR